MLRLVFNSIRNMPLVFILLVALINLGVCHECGNWTYFDRDCYGYGDTRVDWGSAQAICQSRGATLAEASNAEENDFLSRIAKNKGAACVWLGGNDIFQEGVWEWSSGKNVSGFTRWSKGEPNNNGNEDCLNMYKSFNYNWNDESCNNKCNFICAASAIER